MAYDWTGWKLGDKGVIEVEFTFAGGHPDEVALDIYDNGIFLGSADEIKSVTRIVPPLKVGDHVRHKKTLLAAEVLGVDGTEAWIRWCGNGVRTVVLTKEWELVR